MSDAPKHNCLDEQLVYVEHEWVETHGLDCGPFERCYERFWECPVCGQRFTEREVEKLMNDSGEVT